MRISCWFLTLSKSLFCWTAAVLSAEPAKTTPQLAVYITAARDHRLGIDFRAMACYTVNAAFSPQCALCPSNRTRLGGINCNVKRNITFR